MSACEPSTRQPSRRGRYRADRTPRESRRETGPKTSRRHAWSRRPGRHAGLSTLHDSWRSCGSQSADFAIAAPGSLRSQVCQRCSAQPCQREREPRCSHRSRVGCCTPPKSLPCTAAGAAATSCLLPSRGDLALAWPDAKPQRRRPSSRSVSHPTEPPTRQSCSTRKLLHKPSRQTEPKADCQHSGQMPSSLVRSSVQPSRPHSCRPSSHHEPASARQQEPTSNDHRRRT
mmetsp:Transcript_27073/g.89925  ORF Transcript_27073/g.89925 Transcript_27073/m.89925 type:complete len:230 (+) Transcript_27073:1737-2426(+)